MGSSRKPKAAVASKPPDVPTAEDVRRLADEIRRLRKEIAAQPKVYPPVVITQPYPVWPRYVPRPWWDAQIYWHDGPVWIADTTGTQVTLGDGGFNSAITGGTL